MILKQWLDEIQVLAGIETVNNEQAIEQLNYIMINRLIQTIEPNELLKEIMYDLLSPHKLGNDLLLPILSELDSNFTLKDDSAGSTLEEASNRGGKATIIMPYPNVFNQNSFSKHSMHATFDKESYIAHQNFNNEATIVNIKDIATKKIFVQEMASFKTVIVLEELTDNDWRAKRTITVSSTGSVTSTVKLFEFNVLINWEENSLSLVDYDYGNDNVVRDSRFRLKIFSSKMNNNIVLFDNGRLYCQYSKENISDSNRFLRLMAYIIPPTFISEDQTIPRILYSLKEVIVALTALRLQEANRSVDSTLEKLTDKRIDEYCQTEYNRTAKKRDNSIYLRHGRGSSRYIW